jgi:hypothetical protein
MRVYTKLRVKRWLPGQDSNLDAKLQRLLCYRYTTRQCRGTHDYNGETKLGRPGSSRRGQRTIASMNHRLFCLLAGLLLLVAACSGNKSPAPTATPAILATATPEPRSEESPTQAATATASSPVIATPARPIATSVSPTIAPTPTATPRPDGLQFHFGPGVDSFDRSLITRAVEVTGRLLAHGGKVQPPSAVFADSSPQRLADAFAQDAPAESWRAQGMAQRLTQVVAESNYRAIVINTGSASWVQMSASQRLRVVAHEYVHVIQLEQTGLEVADQTLRGRADQAPPAGPFWLLEGSAEVVSWLVLEELDLGSYPESLFDYAANAKPGTVNLAEMEGFVGYHAGRSEGLGLSVLAVDYLLRSRSLDALFDFWRDIGQGFTWSSAFQRQFGLPPAFFYVAFATYYDNVWAGFQP